MDLCSSLSLEVSEFSSVKGHLCDRIFSSSFKPRLDGGVSGVISLHVLMQHDCQVTVDHVWVQHFLSIPNWTWSWSGRTVPLGIILRVTFYCCTRDQKLITGKPCSIDIHGYYRWKVKQTSTKHTDWRKRFAPHQNFSNSETLTANQQTWSIGKSYWNSSLRWITEILRVDWSLLFAVELVRNGQLIWRSSHKNLQPAIRTDFIFLDELD